MACGCAATETSPLLMGGKKRSTKSTKKKSTTKRRTTSTKRRTTKRKMSGGAALSEYLTGSQIPLRVQSSPDWHAPNTSSPPPYAIDLGEAMQSYLFGRPTPNGKDFMVASGLVEKSKGVIDMVGGKKKKRSVSKKKRSVSKKKRSVSKKKRSTKK
jgi:hypothetical protein